MFADLGFDTLTAPQAAVWFGLAMGVAFGILAQITRICLRRAVAGEAQERSEARGTWAIALAVAILGTQAAVAAGLIDFSGHYFLAGNMPVLAIVLGGLMFGAGMVLTRGCASRLTVLAGSGNLRAVFVLLVFAITAHAMLKGGLAPLRTALSGVTLPVGGTLDGGIWTAGALVPLGWVGTGFVLFDDFDPIAMQSLAFTATWTEGLFYAIASTAVPAGFGAALIGGVILGAAVSALVRGEAEWQSFDSPAQTGRYLAGGVLMGVGGVLAGGCTIGAGLSGIPSLSLAAILALGAIIAGARLAVALPALTPARGVVPAE